MSIPRSSARTRSPHTAAADPRRDAVDELLLQDAYNRRKPILGICYGLQSLNVYRAGSLIQHIPDFLPEELRTQGQSRSRKESRGRALQLRSKAIPSWRRF